MACDCNYYSGHASDCTAGLEDLIMTQVRKMFEEQRNSIAEEVLTILARSGKISDQEVEIIEAIRGYQTPAKRYGV